MSNLLPWGRDREGDCYAAQPATKTYAAKAKKPRSSYRIISKWRSSHVSSTISMNLLQISVTMLITPW